MCPRYGGHLYKTTVIGRPETVETVPKPGLRTAREAVALCVTLAQIVRLMLETIVGHRPAGQLAPLLEPSGAALPARHPTHRAHRSGGADIGAGVRTRRTGRRTRRRRRLWASGPRGRGPGSNTIRLAGSGASPSASSER